MLLLLPRTLRCFMVLPALPLNIVLFWADLIVWTTLWAMPVRVRRRLRISRRGVSDCMEENIKHIRGLCVRNECPLVACWLWLFCLLCPSRVKRNAENDFYGALIIKSRERKRHSARNSFFLQPWFNYPMIHNRLLVEHSSYTVPITYLCGQLHHYITIIIEAEIKCTKRITHN